MSAASDHRLHEVWTLGAPPSANAQGNPLERREGMLAARQMLARRASDRSFVASLRKLLASRGVAVVGRFEDREVLALASRLVERGQLRVVVHRKRGFHYEQPDVVEGAMGPAPVVDEGDDLLLDVETDLPGEELVLDLELVGDEVIVLETAHAGTPSPFGDDTEVVVQVAVLHEAAADGVPFCEECEKARLADEAAARADEAAAPAAAPDAEPVEEAVAKLDAPAQAATLRSAAESGAPFCEECEKARLAAAKGDS